MPRMLVVEDDVTVREVVVSYLRAGGHDVMEAADGLTALEIMEETPADLVVLDLMMPGIDGLEVCRRLRRAGDVPIVMLTDGDLAIDAARHEVTLGGVALPLTGREFDLLRHLVAHAARRSPTLPTPTPPGQVWGWPS